MTTAVAALAAAVVIIAATVYARVKDIRERAAA
jgi:hypothetical protein